MTAPQFDQAALRNRVRQRADMVNSEFVSDAELDDYLEAAFQELYGIAVGEWEDLFVQTEEISFGPSAFPFYPENEIKKLRAVRIKNDRFLSPVSLRERELLDSSGGSPRALKPRFYWLYGDANGQTAIQPLPPPDTNYTFVVYYVPQLTLADVSSMFFAGLVVLANWDEYLVLTGAIKCKDKEESDVSVLLTERAALLDNIRKSWQPVDTAEAARVVQLNERRNGFNPYDYDPEDYFS